MTTVLQDKPPKLSNTTGRIILEMVRREVGETVYYTIKAVQFPMMLLNVSTREARFVRVRKNAGKCYMPLDKLMYIGKRVFTAPSVQIDRIIAFYYDSVDQLSTEQREMC